MVIKRIFHISDFHIRNGDEIASRYQEYNSVFDNLFISIKNNINILWLKPEEYLIILTGDIFHNKNIIGNYGLTLYKKLITNLTNIGRTIIFHGNHDKNQNELTQPSLVSSTMEIENLIILKNTQSFIIDNIGFSYVSIDDTLDTFKTCGRINTADLPSFPLFSEDVKYKIALFHGTFGNVKLYNGTITNDLHTPYPFEWIKEFDLALLGDIHLRQTAIYKNTLWGYAGSLIQQNFGEDIINHGYLIWDIKNRSIQEVNVCNNIGLINLKEDDGDILIRVRGNFELLEEVIKNNLDIFPKKIEIKLFSCIDINKLIAICTKYGISFNIISNKIKKEICINSINSINLDTDIQTSNVLLEYFNKHLTGKQYEVLKRIIDNNETLLFNTLRYPRELHDECCKKNKELSTLINTCNSCNDNKIKNKFLIKYIEWENLFCYDNVCWIDLSDIASSTFLISGNNGTGKSAIYDIITMSIWGEITVQKQNPITSGIINFKKDKAYTKIDIELGDDLYRIVRYFEIIKNTFNKTKISIYKRETNNTFSLIKSNNGCNTFINNLIGTIDEFLTASMITQNNDYNILKMNYKDCVSLIDKAANIDFIYNLYNLFKTAINKYRDFKKVIESKKQVYENILTTTTCKDVSNLVNDLVVLDNLKNKLENDNNSITVDINNPRNIMILSTEYDIVINNTDIINERDYINTVKKRDELLSEFKNIPNDDIIIISRRYTNLLKRKNNVNKPCDSIFINTEYNLLHPHIITNFPEEYNKPISELYDIRLEYENKLMNIHDTINICVNNKPKSPSHNLPVKQVAYYNNEEELLNNVKELFKNSCDIDVLIDYCINKETNYNINGKYIEEIKSIKDNISNNRKRLIEIDLILNDLYIKNNEIANITEPLETCDKTYKLSRESIEDINKCILNDDMILEEFYRENDKIQELVIERDRYNKELELLKSNEEYEYNPSCEICCKRRWVIRMKELQEIINKLSNNINKLYDKLYDYTDIDYIDVFNRTNNNKIRLLNNDIYSRWISYNRKIEIANDINNIIDEKRIIYVRITEYENRLNEIDKYIMDFNCKASILYDNYVFIQEVKVYDRWIDWKCNYDKLIIEQRTIEENIMLITKYINYNNDIKPRIENLNKIKEQYEKWKECSNNNKIISAYELININSRLERYDKYIEYIKETSLKTELIEKSEIIEKIRDIEGKIKDINNEITRENTITDYYNTNKENHALLENALIYINDVIDVLNTIIDKFKDYRKELYKTYILRNVVNKTNRLISSLCHEDTKPFELDYLITETKDILHINWLIKNVDIDKNKQVVSIHQASGFQQFVISLALRISLFYGHYEQLFIDEGFTACDQINISIVPQFLKGLLKLYNSIIIVSHINIIQDCSELSVCIDYDKDNKSSSIKYGCKND